MATVAWNTFDEKTNPEKPEFKHNLNVARASEAELKTAESSGAVEEKHVAALRKVSDDALLKTTGLKDKPKQFKKYKDEKKAQSPQQMLPFVSKFVK